MTEQYRQCSILILVVVSLPEVHHGLDQRVGQGTELAEGVHCGARALGPQARTQASRLEHSF